MTTKTVSPKPFDSKDVAYERFVLGFDIEQSRNVEIAAGPLCTLVKDFETGSIDRYELQQFNGRLYDDSDLETMLQDYERARYIAGANREREGRI